MEGKIMIASIVGLMAVIWSSLIVGVHSSALDRVRRQSGDTANPGAEPATELPHVDNTTVPSGNTTVSQPPGGDGSSTVTVTVIVVILVLAVVIGIGVFIFLRIRRRRMAEYEKKTQIQMSSTHNAGVYSDLTAPPSDDPEKPAESPETERLNKEDD